MKTLPDLLRTLIILALCCGKLAASPTSNSDQTHSPPPGSAERKAIMDALRDDYKKGRGDDVVFKVHYIKVHNGWAWVDTTPLDKRGRPVAEGGPNLLHNQDGKWVVMDLSTVEDDPDDPLGPEDASPTYIKNLQKKYPGVPADIFPKQHK